MHVKNLVGLLGLASELQLVAGLVHAPRNAGHVTYQYDPKHHSKTTPKVTPKTTPKKTPKTSQKTTCTTKSKSNTTPKSSKTTLVITTPVITTPVITTPTTTAATTTASQCVPAGGFCETDDVCCSQNCNGLDLICNAEG